MTRFLLGVLLCALAYPGAVWILSGDHWAKGFSLFFIAIFTFPGAVLLALLALGVLRGRGWLRWWQLAAGGALIGAGLSLFWVTRSATSADAGAAGIAVHLFALIFFGACGAIHALAFWAISVAGNPWFHVVAREGSRGD